MERFPDAVEFHPCAIVGADDEGKELMEQCEAGDPAIACWSVYWHVTGSGLLHVEDFKTQEEARQAASLLEKALDVLK